MGISYEMQIKSRTGGWKSFDKKRDMQELKIMYELYKKHPLYDVRIVKITKEVVELPWIDYGETANNS